MIYCDTSLLVAALAPEATTDRVQSWLASRSPNSLCVSDWNITEFSSALGIKVRYGGLSPDQREEVLTRWHLMRATSLIPIPMPDQAWQVATGFCDRYELKLRAGDALHLAIASLGRHSLATLDQTMASAAIALGLTVEAMPAT